MNRFSNRNCLFLLLLILALGQLSVFGQYYPPAITTSGPYNNVVNLGNTGSVGAYTAGYEYTYYYDVTEDQGYWDYTNYGHYVYEEQGYWDYSMGHTDEEGNWVPDPPSWVSMPVWVWMTEATYVSTGSMTTTYSAAAYVSISVYIDSYGNTSLSLYDNHTNESHLGTGSYNFSTGAFSFTSGDTAYAVNGDGSSWSPPPPPPNYASYGPPAMWVSGTLFNWSYTNFNDPYQTTGGVDYYTDGADHYVSFTSTDGSISGTTSYNSSFGGTATNGVFENTSGIDVRAADGSGNYLVGTAPADMPPSIWVNGESVLWKYLGQGASLHHYASDGSGQRLTIDPTSGVITLLGSTSGFYRQKVTWTNFGGADIRAVALDGSLWANGQTPSSGPPDVLVNQAVWRYVGTWDGAGNGELSGIMDPPTTGDHYLGSNAGQRLVVDGEGHVTVFGVGDPVTGTYAPQSEQAGAPKVFTVEGYTIYPGDANGAYFKYQPSVGPQAVWVNGTTYAFANSKENVTQPGVWVDTYVDGNGNFITVAASGVISLQADGTSNWSGSYVSADSELGDGGIFVVVNGSPRYDVRASNGVTILPPQGAPQSGHPSVVKVDGEAWSFGGSTPDNGTNAATDYYFGASAGKRLWIDATGGVSFTNTANATELAGTGRLVGSVFLVSDHDLRACTIGGLPVAPVGTPQWGPAALAVEGTIWNFIGSVADDSLPVHADYYAGVNAGQVISVNSNLQVAGAHSGVFHDGVFVTNDGSDLRALDSTGAQVPPVGAPANGHPLSLRIGGLHWNFMGRYDGKDYYAAALGGQRLSIDASGAVVYSDHAHNVSNAAGTYVDGTYTATSGGTSFNAGTIGNDLDILGNVLSFGSLQGNAQTAGVTLQFMDDETIATLQNALGRPQARWSWNRAATDGGSTALPVMQVDEHGRLNLYDPATAATPQVAPTISLAPGIQSGVQVSKLPKLELSNQTLETDNSVITKTLGDERYLRASGSNQSLALNSGINVNTGSTGSTNTVPANAAAIGQNLQVSSGQVVVGRNNAAANNEVFVVGAGTSPTQTKNALSVSDSGDTTVAGKLTVTGETTLADVAVSGTLTVAGSPVLTQGSGTGAYLTSGQLDGTYLKSTAAASTYLTSTAAASQFLPVTANTVSIGVGNTVGPDGIGIGEGANAGEFAVSLGHFAGNNGYVASGTSSVAIGLAARSPGEKSITAGYYTWADGESSIALGSGSTTRQRGGISIGEGSESNQLGQVVIGAFNELTTESGVRADGDSIFVVGNGTAADARSNAFIIKRNGDAQVSGILTVAGSPVLTQAAAASSYATQAAVTSQFASLNTQISTTYVDKSAYMLAMGIDATAGSGGWAVGNGSIAGVGAVSIGNYAGNNGWAASGEASVSLGYGSHGYGPHSVAVGFWNWAQGDDSVSLGYQSQAGSNCSVAIGKMAQATRWGQVVVGSFNELSTSNSDGGWANNNPLPTDDLFIVGNGTSDEARSNAFVIKRNGDVVVNGALTINNQPAVTQADVDQKIDTARTASNEAYYRVDQPLSVSQNTTFNGSVAASQASVFQKSLVVEGQRDPVEVVTNPATTKIIPKSGQLILVPEQGDISMGEFRSGPLPVANP